MRERWGGCRKGFIRTVVLAMALAGAFLLTDRALAKEYTENGLVFFIYDEEAVLENCLATGTAVSVPSEVDGYRVTAIASRAFAGKSYVSIKLPDSITRIGDAAFQDCDSLVSISLPRGLRKLGSYAFEGCAKLKSVSIGNGLARIEYRTFYHCVSLKTVKLPASLEKISAYAFSDCYKLTDIKLGGKLQAIGEWAFRGDAGLSSLRIPAHVKKVGDDFDIIRLKLVQAA